MEAEALNRGQGGIIKGSEEESKCLSIFLGERWIERRSWRPDFDMWSCIYNGCKVSEKSDNVFERFRGAAWRKPGEITENRKRDKIRGEAVFQKAYLGVGRKRFVDECGTVFKRKRKDQKIWGGPHCWKKTGIKKRDQTAKKGIKKIMLVQKYRPCILV